MKTFSVSETRKNLAEVLNLVDSGETVIIRRGKKNYKEYMIVKKEDAEKNLQEE